MSDMCRRHLHLGEDQATLLVSPESRLDFLTQWYSESHAASTRGQRACSHHRQASFRPCPHPAEQRGQAKAAGGTLAPLAAKAP